MANVFAIHSVCGSIATFLQNTYPVSHDGVKRFAYSGSGVLS